MLNGASCPSKTYNNAVSLFCNERTSNCSWSPITVVSEFDVSIIATTCLLALLFCLGLLFSATKTFQTRWQTQRKEQEKSSWQTQMARAARKADFIARVGDDYGYRSSPVGYIDEWRLKEFPGLIPPLQLEEKSVSHKEGKKPTKITNSPKHRNTDN